MIRCANCHKEEIIGALFCSECGAQLITTGSLRTHSLSTMPGDTNPGTLRVSEQSAAVIIPRSVEQIISMHLLDSGDIIRLSGQMEYTIGRSADGQLILPDVDLAPFDAYSQGVSRVHAALKITEQGIVIADLGSANGTRVNGQKIAAHMDYSVNHGDVLALGKFKLQVLF